MHTTFFPNNPNLSIKEKLKSNIWIAYQATIFVSDKYKIETTSTLPELSIDEYEVAQQIIEKARNNRVFKNSLKLSYSIPQDNYILWLKNSKRNIKSSRAANCSEYGHLLMSYFRRHDIAAEYFIVKDHVFVVIDRKPDSNPEDPSTWGETAVICDMMNPKRKFFPAKDIKKYLNTYQFNETGKFPNVYKPYNGEKTELVFSVNLKSDEEYQASLVKEVTATLIIIYNIATSYCANQNQFFDNQKLSALNCFINQASNKHYDSKITNNQAEIQLNLLIRQSVLELERNLPQTILDEVRVELWNQLHSSEVRPSKVQRY